MNQVALVGNIVANVTSTAGATQWTYSYEPFGVAKSAVSGSGAPVNPMRFTGEYLDSTNLYYLRARQYDPANGRFLSVDPVGQQITDPYVASYVYVNNRPTVLVDPLGLCSWNPFKGDNCYGAAMVKGMEFVVEHPWQAAGVAIGGACVFVTIGQCGVLVGGLTVAQTTSLVVKDGFSLKTLANASCGALQNAASMLPGLGIHWSGVQGTQKIVLNAITGAPGIYGSTTEPWASPGCGIGSNGK